MTDNKYNILITNHSLQQYRGSETYCFFLAREMAKRHNVSIYTPKPGKVSDKMSEFANILTGPAGEFDIIFHNHNNTLSDDFKAKCKIYTTHGKFHKLEVPAKGMDAYVAVSREVAGHYSEFNPYVIHNGIDTEYYHGPDSDRPVKNILYSSNSKSNFPLILRIAALSLGLKFRRIGRKINKFNIKDDLLWADIVFGLGRTAMEAMSCGKKVIIADKRPYTNFGMDGLLTPENAAISQNNNYTGRAMQKPITLLSIRKELKKAVSSTEHWERDWILKYHNIENTALEYIKLAEKVMKK